MQYFVKKPVPTPSGRSGHQWVFPNLDSSRIHSSQNCQARAAWIPAGSALQVLSHITEHNLESFYFAVGCAKILDVQYEINWSKAVPSWHVVLGPRDQLGAGREMLVGSGTPALVPGSAPVQVLGTQSSAVLGYSVQVSLQITSSSCCYGNIKKKNKLPYREWGNPFW